MGAPNTPAVLAEEDSDTVDLVGMLFDHLSKDVKIANLLVYEELIADKPGTYDCDPSWIAKVEGEFTWHSHADSDELFLVLSGDFGIEFRDGLTSAIEGVGGTSLSSIADAQLGSQEWLMKRASLPSTAASMTFCAPWTFVRTHSHGLYSAAGTCLRAAACTMMSMPSHSAPTRTESMNHDPWRVAGSIVDVGRSTSKRRVSMAERKSVARSGNSVSSR